VPVAFAHTEYANKVQAQLHAAGFYCDADLTDETMQKKVFHGQHAQYNFILVVGDREAKDDTVAIRTRDDNKIVGTKPIAQFIADLNDLVRQFK